MFLSILNETKEIPLKSQRHSSRVVKRSEWQSWSDGFEPRVSQVNFRK